jgi:hypothetical protein
VTELKRGSNDANTGGEVTRWQNWAYRYAPSYAGLIGPKDGYFGIGEEKFCLEMRRRVGKGLPMVPTFDDFVAQETGYKFKSGSMPKPPPLPVRRPIWIYTAPGSGADWWFGPSFDLGEMCKNILGFQHQPLAFTKGGYLGFMGGDSKFSYNEVTYDQHKSLEYNLDNNPDVQEALLKRKIDPNAKVAVELWFSGYSQSADGMEDALEILFGDGGFIHPGDPTNTPSAPGKYRLLRDRINGLIQFGNPSTKDTGIARKVRPAWLDVLVRNVNVKNDFYAVAKDEIRPAFYAIIVQAEMELPFFIHVLKVAVPIILGFATPLGGLFGPMGAMMIAAMSGMNAFLPLLGGLMGTAGSAGDEEVDRKLIEMLSITGLIKNIPGLLGLITALPGLQAHGGYHLYQPDFGMTGTQFGYNMIADYRR